ncbi:hypothetical protein M271_13905 [Streptomyces rapamycinicus NRRL 5491]|uniref:Uncharacterized protein n=2 Tax=Streptomyces rapamycinicus TaxID=1226757 RepID=A0A0A0N5L8_STRRN|nr:hypothetical protein M271_13905 [Streptomyces rapamycinicus NRRL 5491]MBB4781875.1 hypothetical protein [Streptomyces rapamycinicus]RLV73482.1 hypothetical protein D3C57_129690 [Streptomyces rapamycinicus NRRL 5491]
MLPLDLGAGLVLAGADRPGSPLFAATPDRLNDCRRDARSHLRP